MFRIALTIVGSIALFSCSKTLTIQERVNGKEFPSVFQAWYGIDMPSYPQNTIEQRLTSAAKHDLLWEEPLSQLGEGVDLVLGLVWDHPHHGLANSFTKESLINAKRNRRELLKKNPNMVLLFEVRWRDAPSSFLPEESDWWLRDSNGEIVKGWLGGWEPFYKLDYNHEAFQDNVARQAKLALESGVYDGVMLDWSGHLEITKKIREAIGKDGLILINLHDDIEDAKSFAPYINGSFMELNPKDKSSNTAIGGVEEKNLRNWDTIREALQWFETNLQKPTINALEVWGDRKDLARMRATTTLGLCYSDGYVLYGDPNPLKTPDHLHDWYSFWDTDLGKPMEKLVIQDNGLALRAFENGQVVYNHFGNGSQTINFKYKVRRVSTGEIGNSFLVEDRDGDIFIPIK